MPQLDEFLYIELAEACDGDKSKILAVAAEARARGATEQKLTLSSFKVIALLETTPLRATVKGRKLSWVGLGKLCLENL